MDYNTRFSKYPCVIVFCQEIQDAMNAERLTSILEIFTQKDGRISSSGEFLDHEDQLRYLLKPLTAAGNPIQIEVQIIPYIEAVP